MVWGVIGGHLVNNMIKHITGVMSPLTIFHKMKRFKITFNVNLNLFLTEFCPS